MKGIYIHLIESRTFWIVLATRYSQIWTRLFDIFCLYQTMTQKSLKAGVCGVNQQHTCLLCYVPYKQEAFFETPLSALTNRGKLGITKGY